MSNHTHGIKTAKMVATYKIWNCFSTFNYSNGFTYIALKLLAQHGCLTKCLITVIGLQWFKLYAKIAIRWFHRIFKLIQAPRIHMQITAHNLANWLSSVKVSKIYL